ncbi:MAG: GNAT family N-acetyltransferase [Proteobacteria bacterium]|nr:GNAT family N-acetyltransferase [Pseudomonadota bacterium]
MKNNMHFRFAKPEDAELLAPLNAQLIRDEGHSNSMTVAQLVERMSGWLRGGEYETVLFEDTGIVKGYALFRQEAEHVYLRQLFVRPEFRRHGIGRDAISWLWHNAWQGAPRLRIDVLVGNRDGQAFWRSIGFREYCLTMEMESPYAH